MEAYPWPTDFSPPRRDVATPSPPDSRRPDHPKLTQLHANQREPNYRHYVVPVVAFGIPI